MNDVELDERYEKWRKPTIACVLIFSVLVVYFFVYPVAVINLDKRDAIADRYNETIILTAKPLEWCYQNFDWYGSLIGKLTGEK